MIRLHTKLDTTYQDVEFTLVCFGAFLYRSVPTVRNILNIKKNSFIKQNTKTRNIKIGHKFHNEQ